MPHDSLPPYVQAFWSPLLREPIYQGTLAALTRLRSLGVPSDEAPSADHRAYERVEVLAERTFLREREQTWPIHGIGFAESPQAVYAQLRIEFDTLTEDQLFDIGAPLLDLGAGLSPETGPSL